jgi:hypothetical protein
VAGDRAGHRVYLAAQERHSLGLAVFGRIGLEELGAHDLAVATASIGRRFGIGWPECVSRGFATILRPFLSRHAGIFDGISKGRSPNRVIAIPLQQH